MAKGELIMFDFINSLGPWVYLLIFVGKLIEVSFSTLRIMFVSRGNKALSLVCGFFEIVLWVIIAGNVLNDLYEDPMKALVYCVAFTIGILLGILLEQKLAVGLTSIQIISLTDDGEKIGATLRENGFGVTILEGHSVNGTKRQLLFVQLRRRKIQEAIRLARSVNPDVIVSVSDVKSVHGGFFK